FRVPSWYNIDSLAKGGANGLLKWTNTGQITPNTVYTFTWGIVGKAPWYLVPDVYALSTHLYRSIRDHLTTQASVPEGYPRYSQHQDTTLFQVRAPIYTLTRVIYVEEVLEIAARIMRTFTTGNLGVMKEAQF